MSDKVEPGLYRVSVQLRGRRRLIVLGRARVRESGAINYLSLLHGKDLSSVQVETYLLHQLPTKREKLRERHRVRRLRRTEVRIRAAQERQARRPRSKPGIMTRIQNIVRRTK